MDSFVDKATRLSNRTKYLSVFLMNKRQSVDFNGHGNE